jgi:dephospho-CoA kinase
MHSAPLQICLTGGVATGKSRVAGWFMARGWKVICTDQIVHELYEPGTPLVHAIAHEFGPEVLTHEGRVNRVELGKRVFTDESARNRLNALVHPKVREEWRKQAAEGKVQGQKVMVVIPLAYETQVQEEFSQVWVVACSDAEQKKRMEQRGFQGEESSQRVASQWPLQKKIDLADVVIWNNADWELTEQQLEQIAHRFH